MQTKKLYDVIIIGGSYSGLAAAMALGRALRNVLVIDSGEPCNRQTPHSHNFLTQDGKTPQEILNQARTQVERYLTVSFVNGRAQKGMRIENGFEIHTNTGQNFRSQKLIFATGIRDKLRHMEGYAACWGISLLHCPYCHGYEVRNETTGVLGMGDKAFEQAMLVSNWTKHLTLFSGGIAGLTDRQSDRLREHGIRVVEKEIDRLQHYGGRLEQLVFSDGTVETLKVLYTHHAFEQHCDIPQNLGCELTEEGYLRTDPSGQTTVPGIYACGDNASRLRTVANAVAMGTTAGMMLNKEMVLEAF